MPTITAKTLWDNHPYPDFPCDRTLFENQCAIRMGVALERSGASMASFVGARCWARPSHAPKHILRAQELADWLLKQTTLVGRVQKHKKVTSADFWGTPGIVFIRDGWGATDHIDVWDGEALKGGSPDYFLRGKEVWFWELPHE
jgi:hypothetical protein